MKRILSIIFLIGLYWLKKIKELNKALNERQAELIYLNDKVIESERLYKSILDASPNAIVMLDMKYNIILASNAAIDVLGYSGDSLIGENILQFFLDSTCNLLI